MAVAPDLPIGVPPATIPEMGNGFTVPASALFATALRTLKAHQIAQLRPVDRVEPTVLRTDWHQLGAFPLALADGKYR